MNALIRKELRLLMWPLVVAVLTATIPAIFYAWRMSSWAERSYHESMAGLCMAAIVFGFAAAAAVMCLTSFGQEFTLRTFAFSVAQPVRRQRLWLIKTAILAIAVIIATAIALAAVLWVRETAWNITLAPYLSTYPRMLEYAPRFFDAHLTWRTMLLIALTAYSGGLWTALFFRNFFTALSMTVLIPTALEGFTQWTVSEGSANVAVTVVLLVYSVCGFLFARWQLLHAQDVAWTGGTITFGLRRKSAGALFAGFRRTTPFFAMLKKEFQLQQVAIVVCAALLPLHLLSFLIRANIAERSPNPGLYVVIYIGALWFVLPTLIGSASVAEERRLATFEALLTQPVSRRAALLIKLGVTLALSVLLGALVPYCIERLAAQLGVPWGYIKAEALGHLILASVGLGAAAFFCSTQARSSIDAFCMSLVSTPIFFAAGVFFASPNANWTSEIHEIPRYGLLTPYFCAVFLVPPVIWLTWKNFQQVQFRWTTVARTGLILALAFVVTWTAASFTWNRGWEWFMTKEPKHGAPVMRVGDHAEIAACSGPLVLLPDGRIWTARHRLFTILDRRNDDHVVAITLTDCEFLESRWTSLAVRGDQVFAVKNDGTVWQIRTLHYDKPKPGWSMFRTDPPKQFGTESNWATVTCSALYCLALKRDGSLWGWGDNATGQLGPGPHWVTNGPVAIWPDSKWSAVFPMDHLCLGIKRDGTVWTWGKRLRWGNDLVAEYQPKRVMTSATNWTSFAGPMRYSSSEDCVVGTQTDGTLWAFLAPRFGPPEEPTTRDRMPLKILNHSYVVTEIPQQIAPETKWERVYGRGDASVAALSKEGGWYSLVPYADRIKQSRHSDWIAISTRWDQRIGLAADGTLTYHSPLDPYPGYFAPSRLPVWTTNIFATR